MTYGLLQGWIESITLERYRSSSIVETKVWIIITVRPELDIVSQNMAKRRIELLQQKYLHQLGVYDFNYLALEVVVDIDLDCVTHDQWAAKLRESELKDGPVDQRSITCTFCAVSAFELDGT